MTLTSDFDSLTAKLLFAAVVIVSSIVAVTTLEYQDNDNKSKLAIEAIKAGYEQKMIDGYYKPVWVKTKETE
jgi:ABC-type cobalt transport system substrate-binding protein